MNDTTIIKSISKVHSIIIDLLIFILITLFTIYFTLHIGLKLDKFILPGLKIEKLYIKWDEKISVNIDSIKITKSNTKSTFDPTSLNVEELLKNSRILGTFFSDVHIEHIQINEINATFSYIEHRKGFLEVRGETLNLLTTIDINDHLIHISVKEFTETSTNTNLTADLIGDTIEDRLYGVIKVNVADTLPLQLYLLADDKKVKVWGNNYAPISKPIGPVVRLAHLNPAVNPWIIDYLKGDILNIEYLKATLYYDNPISFLDTLDIKAAYSNVEYIFAPGYAPAIGKKVDLGFKNRTLYIYPRNATFYGQPGGTTWIKIDFENPLNPLLTVDVDTTARLTPKIITWLEGYGIGLPFYQTKGVTTVKLAIWITLDDVDINAKGNFSTPNSTFNFTGTDINVKDVKINLNNTDVEISSLRGDLLDKAIRVDLTGKFNPIAEKGRFDVLVKELHFGGKDGFLMDKGHKELSFSYLLQPNADRLIFPKTYWEFDHQKITVQPFVAPFRFSTLSGSIPATYIHNKERFKAYVSGNFDIKKLTTDLMIDLVQLNTSELSLEQTNVPLEVHYDKILRVQSNKKAKWKLFENDITLYPSKFSYLNHTLHLEDVHLSALGIVNSHITGKYHMRDGKGKIILKQLVAKSDNITLLDIEKDIKIYLRKKENQHRIEVPVFNLKFRSKSNGWEMGIKNIELLSSYSPVLQEYNITKGSIYFTSNNRDEKLKIHGHLDYPYTIIVKNNKPIGTINFSGYYADDKLSVFTQNGIAMELTYNKLTLSADKIGIDLFSVFDFMGDHNREQDKKSKSDFEVDLKTTNSYIYFDKSRRAITDKLLLQYKDDELKAQLLYGKKGGAAMELSADGRLYIYGDHLNDHFMEELAEFSEFKGGELSFYLSGTTEVLDGVVRMKNTTIKDYKAINNTLAFINTIPALVTFSVPHYNTKGLYVTEAYAGFHYENSKIKINGFRMVSPELTFNGQGVVDLDTQTVDMETSLVTSATNNLSKIPLLGYILVGKEKETITTTMTLKGPMSDPVVENTLAKDIGVGSFNIIKRALTFPVHYIDQAQKSIDKVKEKKKSEKKK